MAEKTEAIQALRAMAPGDMRDHFLQPREIWARAYAQFIASESSSPLLKQQLEKAINKAASRQWQPDDFAPLAQAIEVFFKSLGWLPA